MQRVFLLGLSLAPVALLLFALLRVDRNREPIRVVLVTLLLGALTPIPVIVTGLALAAILGIPHDPTTIGEAIAVSFILAALVEEAFKFLVLWRYSAQHDAFDEPFDGIVYGTAASLGFAATENILYVFRGETMGESLFIATLRAFTAVPMHAMCGVVMGLCIGIGRFRPQARPWWMAIGVGGAIALHGVYDSFAFGSAVMAGQGRGDLAALSAAGLVATTLFAAIVCLLAIARMRRDQIVEIAAEWPVEASLPPQTDGFLLPLPPPPPRVARVPWPPPSEPIPDRSPPPAETSPVPVLPMVAMVLEAIATGSAVLLLLVSLPYGDTPAEDIPDAVGLLACGLIGISGLTAIGGMAASIAALARRERWPGASIGALLVGGGLALLIVVLVMAAVIAA